MQRIAYTLATLLLTMSTLCRRRGCGRRDGIGRGRSTRRLRWRSTQARPTQRLLKP